MRIAWDERKRTANLAKHGLDFADVALFGWRNALLEEARPSGAGRKRLKAVGDFNGKTVLVIFSLLGAEAISIVSFRPASKTERAKLP